MALAAAILLVGCATNKPKATPYKPDPATSSTITGQVTYTGKPGQAIAIDMDQDPDCKKLYPDGKRQQQLVLVNAQGALANSFVYVKTGLEGTTFDTPPRQVRIDQKGCWFEPRVIGLQVAQPFEVTNSDRVTHNIHPEAKLNREWNQSQAPDDASLKRRFAQPEVMIRVKCNVHKWMRAWIGVLPHPYFAVTSTDGQFEIKGLPPGKYTLAAWHETLGERELSITVPPASTSRVSFQFAGQ